jgi:hypothetical protein
MIAQTFTTGETVEAEELLEQEAINKSLGETTVGWDAIEKAYSHLYIRRWVGKNGKWQYFYAKDLIHPLAALKRLFGIEEKSIEEQYEKEHIKQDYDVDKKTFSAHVLEYLSNRIKWDTLFSNQENREKYKKPVKQRNISAAVHDKIGGDGQLDIFKENPKVAKKPRIAKNPKVASVDKPAAKEENTIVINRSLMRKIWATYNQAERIDERSAKDNAGTGQGAISTTPKTVQPGDDTGHGGRHGAETVHGKADNQGDDAQLFGEFGDRPGADVPPEDTKDTGGNSGGRSGSGGRGIEIPGSDSGDGTLSGERRAVTGERKRGGGEGGGLLLPGLEEQVRGVDGAGLQFGLGLAVSDGSGGRVRRGRRLTTGQTRNVREACLKLLNTKKDNEMTEADKELLRQYEGAGGLGEEGSSTHGTLYEFYTPRTVTKKVWQLVDKYIPGAKKVLEPAAGTGRFAEDRSTDTFTLNEFDSTSSRIAGILHPEAEIKQGAFQAMFKPGKEYTGEKYDVVIGNPPYGAYAGLWKGKGEGADHQKYEEYFIDRGLDTLREGGIMAFVVPSSFLRNGESKIKQKIAGKGKLMEAWRLPNGTFNTTGVGTDIIIIRKEQGDPAQFSNNAYFEHNPSMVMGDETTRTGRFGEEQYVGLRAGDTFDEAIERINAEDVEAPPLGVPTEKENLKEKTEVNTKEAEKHRSRSDAMIGNQNAKKYGMSVEILENGKFGIKTGENAWVAAIPPAESGMAFMGGGLAEFDSREAAEKYMQEYADRRNEQDEKRSAKITSRLEINKKFIEEAVKHGGTVDAKGYLHDPVTKQRIKLSGNNRELYEEAIGGTSQSQVIAERSHAVDTADEFNAKYNKHVAQQALSLWKATQWDGSIDTKELSENDKKYLETSENYVKTASDKWYDIVNFASGNIYDKLDQLDREKELISKSEYERQKKILEKAMPKQKTVLEFEVSPLSAISEKFITGDIDTAGYKDPSGKKIGEEYSLILNEAFKRWLRLTPRDELALTTDATVVDIINYVDKKRVITGRGKTEAAKEANRAEAQRTISARRESAERLFNQFIREQLSIEDQKRLAETYNRQYNGTVQADYTKIPVFLDGISNQFKGDDFKANVSQIKGISWLANQGNGIVAFDVGVGKTITAIMAAVNDIQMGRCKRPLISVPKAVYKNWIFEIKELFPNILINELGNFSDISQYKATQRVTIQSPNGTNETIEPGGLMLPEGSLSVCTYEALEQIGFTDETLNGDMAEAFMEAVSATDEEDSDRKKAKDEESIMTKVGKASRAGDNWINWEDTGFDHITVDEAHNFRNSFSKPRNKNKGDADEFRDVPGGSTALRGLKLFAISQMVQKHNNGRNVHLLTATPFQNSPVEIYNMLSLVAREQLKKAGIFNFHEFLTQFADLKSEVSVDSKNDITQKNVMKGFKNLPALQNLLNQYIMKIDGEDAGIIRPDKEEHIIELNPTTEQRDITESIRAYMESNPDPKTDPGATLRCINALRQIALSPALVDGFKFLDPVAMSLAGIRKKQIAVQHKDFVKDSPKMKFVCDTTVNIYKQHPDKGQIIHLPQGIEHYEEVKKYLVAQGVPADAIAFMATVPKGKKAPPYLKAGDAGNDQKEELKEAFNNPEQKVKIIIGSDSIKEGVNLNGNTIQTYACMLDWNPTGTQQLIGRSHRQGNKQGKVHITFPLMNDSVDSFMYQKHDEKGTRLDTLWNSKKDKIDIDDIDPEALKFSLIKDPKKRADLFIKEKTADLRQSEKIAVSTSDKILNMAWEYNNLDSDIKDEQKDIEKMKEAIKTFNQKSDRKIIEESIIEFGNSSWYIYDNYASVSANNIGEVREKYVKAIKDTIADSQKSIQHIKGKMEAIENKIKRYGVDDMSNKDAVEKVRKRYVKEAQGYQEQIETIEGSREQYIKEATRKINEESKPGISVDRAIAKNTADVSNNLYSMEVVKERVMKERGMKKSLMIWRNRIYLRVW